MEKVHFILGRLANDRTELCYQEIKSKLEENHHKPLLLLVPEQFNLQTQRDLSEYLGSGLLDAMVMSFNTLARDVFREVGMPDVTIIDDLERMIILKRIVEEHQKELVFYKKNYKNIGFLESTNRFITILEQAGIEDNDLSDMQQSTQTSMLLKSKLSDIQMIYTAFKTYLGMHFLTTENYMTLLAQVIQDSKKLEETEVWIDGYYGFTHPQLLIIEALARKVKRLTITLPMDRTYQMNEAVQPSHTFFESIINMQKIMEICKKQGLSYTVRYQKETKTIPLAKKAVYLKTYKSRTEEVEAVARRISYLVREEGYRYRDFAIVVGDLESYKTSLESLLNLYDLPYFLDMPYNIHTNPLTSVIEYILEVVTTNYSYKSMMSLLRTYMIPNVTRYEIDLIENELITYNIKGKKKWQSEWTFIKDEEQKEKINQAREKILGPIMAFEKRLTKLQKERKRDVKHLTEALYHFLEDIGAYHILQTRIETHKDNRLLELEYTQTWTKVIEVFERLVDILGNDKMSLATYKRILITSFSYIKMGIIPPTLDQVIVGDIERMRLHNVKACFILGFNEGVIPKSTEKTSMFSDMDKVVLQTLCGQDKGAKSRLSDLLIRQPLYGDRFLIYTILTKATHRLYISAALADENGTILRPSAMYFELKKSYGEMQEIDTLEMVERPLATLSYVGYQMREYIEGRGTKGVWQDALSFYKVTDPWKEQIDRLITYMSYTNQQHYLKPKTAKMLYGSVLKTSISQLESFKRCACCYFLKYGVKAKERKFFLNHAEVGTLFHAALERYPKELEAIHETWTTATTNQRETCVHRAIEYTLSDVNYAQKENTRFKFTASKVEKMTQRAVRALTSHLKNGEFVPKGYEVQFGEGQSFPPIHITLNEQQSIEIRGTIDRIDIYHSDNDSKQYVKILDYKSGKQDFDLTKVYYGLQLQLLLYLDAYLEKNPDQIEAGVFYFHINKDYIKYEKPMDEESINAANLKQFQLSGLTLNQSDIIHALDKDGTTLPVKMKKDNTPYKNAPVATLEQFEELRKHVLEIVESLGKEILEGKVSVRPCVVGDKSPCQYCAYQSICQYDEEMPDNESDVLNEKVNVWKALGVEEDK